MFCAAKSSEEEPGEVTLIEQLARYVPPLAPTASLVEILGRFLEDPSLMGLPIVDHGRLLGVLRRSVFFESDYVGRLGNAHLWNARKDAVSLCCFQPCLVAAPDKSVEEAAKMIASRGDAIVHEEICVARDGSYVGIVSPSVLLEALRLHLEARVEQRTQELARATRQADAARLEAERANSAKSDFLSRMSHELRTPMNAILGFGQLLEMEDLTPDQRDSVEQILHGGEHLLNLINEVLDISRIESGRISLSLEAVPLTGVITDALALLRRMAGEKRITIDEVYPASVALYVWADRQRLMQVVLNLISNAIKYNREEGRIIIEVTEAPGEVSGWCVSICDTGPGIPEGQREKLFVPFERLEAEVTAVQGTGLGLALSKRLVSLMGGEIGLKAGAECGSTFFFTLKAAESPLQSLSEEEDAPTDEKMSVGGGFAATVLYIEDNLPNLRLVERLMSRRGRTKLIAAMQGSVGVELARDHRPDLILLDLHLPDQHGSRVLAQLRADPRTHDIPVVVISADATPSRTDALLAAGAAAYLTKPLQVKSFHEMLDTLVPEAVPASIPSAI